MGVISNFFFPLDEMRSVTNMLIIQLAICYIRGESNVTPLQKQMVKKNLFAIFFLCALLNKLERKGPDDNRVSDLIFFSFQGAAGSTCNIDRAPKKNS